MEFFTINASPKSPFLHGIKCSEKKTTSTKLSYVRKSQMTHSNEKLSFRKGPSACYNLLKEVYIIYSTTYIEK